MKLGGYGDLFLSHLALPLQGQRALSDFLITRPQSRHHLLHTCTPVMAEGTPE